MSSESADLEPLEGAHTIDATNDLVLDAGDQFIEFAQAQIHQMTAGQKSHVTTNSHGQWPVYSRVVCADAVSRAAAYVAQIPGAVSGQNGHNETYKVAIKLRKGFGLSYDDAWPILKDWNAKCEPPWADRELEHKLEDAANVDGPVGYLLQSPMGNGTILNGVHTRGVAGASSVSDVELEPLQFVDAWAAASKPKPHKAVIVEGLLRRGEVASIIAATKAGKSWFALQLLMSVAKWSRLVGAAM